jgi:hypothetical protein
MTWNHTRASAGIATVPVFLTSAHSVASPPCCAPVTGHSDWMVAWTSLAAIMKACGPNTVDIAAVFVQTCARQVRSGSLRK